jgi:hypothetical protein
LQNTQQPTANGIFKFSFCNLPCIWENRKGTIFPTLVTHNILSVQRLILPVHYDKTAVQHDKVAVQCDICPVQYDIFMVRVISLRYNMTECRYNTIYFPSPRHFTGTTPHFGVTTRHIEGPITRAEADFQKMSRPQMRHKVMSYTVQGKQGKWEESYGQ